MRSAPRVHIDLGCNRGERIAIAILAACAGASVSAWLASWAMIWRNGPVDFGWLAAWALVGAIGAAGLAWRMSRTAASGLTFDGNRWSLESVRWAATVSSASERRSSGEARPPVSMRSRDNSDVVASGAIEVMLDLGFWMLLRLRADSHGRFWIGVSAGQAGASWVALRGTLFLCPGVTSGADVAGYPKG